MRHFKSFSTLAFSLAVAGCATAPMAPPEVVIRTAPVAVAVGCVVDRPAPVVPLNQQLTQGQWRARAPGARARTVQAQAGRRLNYEDALRAATAACAE